MTQGGVDDAPSSIQRPSGRGMLACLLFVLSGTCGLAYEALWARRLGLFLGNSILLHMVVLAAFMGGLAGGSFLLSGRAERLRHPLRLYGALELAIAAYALLFPLLADAAQNIVTTSATTPTAKIAIAMLLLLPPTLLMGGTYPALTAWFARQSARQGDPDEEAGAEGANWLYAANCAGAVGGVLLTGFVAIPTFGLFGTGILVSSFNALIGLAALLFSRAIQPHVFNIPEEVGPSVSPQKETPSLRRAVLLVIALSGATAFLYELVWTRLFALTLGNSTYSFTLMLAAFITGLAGGSLTAARLTPLKRSPAVALAACQVGIGLVVTLSIPFYQRLPFWFWQMRWLLRPVEASLGLYHLFQYLLTFAVMAVPTFLFGLAFPAAIRALVPVESRNAARAAAQVYGCNTLGTLAGVFLTGALLIPWLGLQTTLQLGAGVNLLLGMGLAALLPDVHQLKTVSRRQGGALVAGTAGLLILAFLPGWHPLSFAQGTFRLQAEPPADWPAYLGILTSHHVLSMQEDFGTTVAVLEGTDTDGERTIRLIVDGKTDASSYGDMPTQILLGQIPLFLKPDSRDVFVLGLGSGVTAGSVLTHPVERVDCVELSRGVSDVLHYFDEANHTVRNDPRFHLLVEDGKAALPAMPRLYDVLISEPPNPWISGVGNLFSQDFYRQAAKKLKPGGVLAQWFHTYEFDDRLVATVIRTFRTVFPHAVLFNSGGRDVILVGSQQPIVPNFTAMTERLNRPEVAEDLARIHITRLAALLARQTHSPTATQALEQGGDLNTDDLPVLEYLAPHAQYISAVAKRIEETDGRLHRDPDLLLNQYGRSLPQGLLTQADQDALLTSLSDSRLRHAALQERLLADALRRWPKEPRYALQMAQLLGSEGQEERALTYLERAIALGSEEAKAVLERVGSRLKKPDAPVFGSGSPSR